MHKQLSEIPVLLAVYEAINNHPTVMYLADDWLSSCTQIDVDGQVDISPVELIVNRMVGTTISVVKFTKHKEVRDPEFLLHLIDHIINDLHSNNPQLKPLILQHRLGLGE